jgi:hypothetical protein
MIGGERFRLDIRFNTYRVGANLRSGLGHDPGDRLRGTDSTQVILNYLPQSFAAAQQPCGLQRSRFSAFAERTHRGRRAL